MLTDIGSDVRPNVGLEFGPDIGPDIAFMKSSLASGYLEACLN